jgi:hypothetical protein
MANSGVSYTTAVVAPLASGDWDDDTVATGNNLLSDAMSMNGLVSKLISVRIDTPNLAVTDDVTVYILKEDGKDGGGEYQDEEYPPPIDNARAYPIHIVQNEITRWAITLYGIDLNNFKIRLVNSSGQTLTTSVYESDGTILPAS